MGHFSRRDGLEQLMPTGKVEGKRDKGRQIEKLFDGLTSWQGICSVTSPVDNAQEIGGYGRT